MESRLIKSLIIRNDLEEAKSEVLAKGLLLSIAHLKTALAAFSNLNELERGLRPIYKTNPELSQRYSLVRDKVEFFSYLRNKFVGHLTDDLLNKTVEWKPEILLSLEGEHDPNTILIYNFSILETAINTYVDDVGAHKIFDTETDLAYPPDFNRFQETFLASIDLSSEFLRSVEIILKPMISPPNEGSAIFELWTKAGLTEFTYIRGKGR
tara:strand:- start:649 stop:1278 length:630 start_codon:yes stop_codon:yes gene_type:complete